MYSFPGLEPVCCSVSGSNCCFLTCIQISHEAGKVVWYSHLFKNFPQFVVICTVKGFDIVNTMEVDVFLELSCWWSTDDPVVGNLISGSSAYSETTLNIWKFLVHMLLKKSEYIPCKFIVGADPVLCSGWQQERSVPVLQKFQAAEKTDKNSAADCIQWSEFCLGWAQGP